MFAARSKLIWSLAMPLPHPTTRSSGPNSMSKLQWGRMASCAAAAYLMPRSFHGADPPVRSPPPSSAASELLILQEPDPGVRRGRGRPPHETAHFLDVALGCNRPFWQIANLSSLPCGPPNVMKTSQTRTFALSLDANATMARSRRSNDVFERAPRRSSGKRIKQNLKPLVKSGRARAAGVSPVADHPASRNRRNPAEERYPPTTASLDCSRKVEFPDPMFLPGRKRSKQGHVQQPQANRGNI